MFNIKFHKVLKNGSKNIYIYIYHHLKKEIMQNLNISSEMNFDFFKMPKKGATPKSLPK